MQNDDNITNMIEKGWPQINPKEIIEKTVKPGHRK
jgi:hypothetical protein